MNGLNLGIAAENRADTAARTNAVAPDPLRAQAASIAFDESLEATVTACANSSSVITEVWRTDDTASEIDISDENGIGQDNVSLEHTDDCAALENPVADDVLEAIIGVWTGTCGITVIAGESAALSGENMPPSSALMKAAPEIDEAQKDFAVTQTDNEAIGEEPLSEAVDSRRSDVDIDAGGPNRPATGAVDPGTSNLPDEGVARRTEIITDWPVNNAHSTDTLRPLASHDVVWRPAHLLASTITRYLTDTLVLMKDEGVEITLSPEESGRIRLVLSQREYAPHLTIWAERPEVLEQLRRNTTDLVDSFREAGIDNASFQFDDNPAERDEQPWRQTGPETAAPDLILPEMLQYSRPVIGMAEGQRRLDIRM